MSHLICASASSISGEQTCSLRQWVMDRWSGSMGEQLLDGSLRGDSGVVSQSKRSTVTSSGVGGG